MGTVEQPTDSVAGGAQRHTSGVSTLTRGTRFAGLRQLPDETGVVVALAVLVLGIGAYRPAFLSTTNLVQMLSNTAFFGMIALAMVFLLALGEVDLSVGYNFNFSAVIAAELMVAGVNAWLAVLAGIAFGAFLGLVNGLLTELLRVPVIIVTLGTFSMFQGLSLVVTKATPIVPPGSDRGFFNVANIKLGDVSLIAVVFVLLAVVLHVVLKKSRFGYRVQAIGSNTEAARLVGMPISRVRIATLMLVGAVCGLSGCLFLGNHGAIDTQAGSTFMLQVVAAAIIGGTPLTGGSGTVIGALFGALIISVISSGVVFLGIANTWSTFVTGAVIVVAVAIDQTVRRRRKTKAGTSGLSTTEMH